MLRTFARTTAFFSKWMAEVVRQPALMVSLVVGPFLVLLAFGLGVDVSGPRPNVVVVQPPGTSDEIQPLPEELNGHVNVVGSTTSLDEAREMLRKGKADAVAVLPPDPLQTVKSGKHVPLHILTNEVDPVNRSYSRAYLNDQVAQLNQQTLAKAIGEAQGPVRDAREVITRARPFLDALRASDIDLANARGQVTQLRDALAPLADATTRADEAASRISVTIPGVGKLSDQTAKMKALVTGLQSDVAAVDRRLGQGSLPSKEELDRMATQLDDVDASLAELEKVPPDVLSAPFELQLENIAPFVPDFTGFYAPAVLVLLIQHLAITLGALSMARIRLLGLMDLLRVAPVRTSEVVLGNYLSYGALCSVAGTLLVGVSVAALNVPVFGPWAYVVLGLGLLVAVSLGIGFAIAMISSSEQQAAQLAMLVLLCSIFFSGFVFSLERIAWPVRAVSYALPSTYAIRLLQDVMLRGVLRHPADVAVLAAAAAGFFVVTLLLFKREFRPA